MELIVQGKARQLLVAILTIYIPMFIIYDADKFTPMKCKKVL